jgi:hypothetical protein
MIFRTRYFLAACFRECILHRYSIHNECAACLIRNGVVLMHCIEACWSSLMAQKNAITLSNLTLTMLAAANDSDHPKGSSFPVRNVIVGFQSFRRHAHSQKQRGRDDEYTVPRGAPRTLMGTSRIKVLRVRRRSGMIPTSDALCVSLRICR